LAWEDVRIPFSPPDMAEWKAVKDKYPFGQLPVLVVDGEQIAESAAIERYAARLGGLHGHNDAQSFRIDMINEFLIEGRQGLFTIRSAKDDTAKAAAHKDYFGTVVPRNFGTLEKMLASNDGGKGYFVGDSVTLADIHFYVASETLKGFEKDVLAAFPLLKALNERVAARKRIAKWLTERPATAF